MQAQGLAMFAKAAGRSRWLALILLILATGVLQVAKAAAQEHAGSFVSVSSCGRPRSAASSTAAHPSLNPEPWKV